VKIAMSCSSFLVSCCCCLKEGTSLLVVTDVGRIQMPPSLAVKSTSFLVQIRRVQVCVNVGLLGEVSCSML